MNAVKLTEDNRDYFTQKDMARGRAIFESGRVGKLERSRNEIWVEVEGDRGQSYQVYFDPASRYFECECPRFMETDACKHAWAAMLLWDRVVEAAWRPSWEHTLDELVQSETSERNTESLRISYGLHLDSPSTKGYEFRVYAQKRLKNGNWGKRRLFGKDLENLLPAEDAGLIALLEGSRRVGEPSWFYNYGSGSRRPFSLELSQSALVTILEQLVATGRFYDVQANDEFGEALTIDHGSVWRPHLALGSGEPRPLQIDFRSEDRVIDVDTVRLSLLPHWFLAAGQFHRLDRNADCRWLHRVVTGNIVVAAEQVNEFYGKILKTSMAPFLELDEGWERVELEADAVAAVIQILPTEGDRCRLALQFDYDGARVAHDAQQLLGDPEQQRLINRLWSHERQGLETTSQTLGIQPQDLGLAEFSLSIVQAPLDELAR